MHGKYGLVHAINCMPHSHSPGTRWGLGGGIDPINGSKRWGCLQPMDYLERFMFKNKIYDIRLSTPSIDVGYSGGIDRGFCLCIGVIDYGKCQIPTMPQLAGRGEVGHKLIGVSAAAHRKVCHKFSIVSSF